MTVPFLMPDVAAREARRLHLRNPETYTVAMLARRFGVSIACLRSSMEAVGQRSRKNERMAERPPALPPEQEVRRRLVALERADTRDLTGRILDTPRPGRSALDMRSGG
jgi:transposase-like protein